MEIDFSINTPKVLNLLYSKLLRIRKQRQNEISAISNVFEDPIGLAKYYVIPDCQEYNPADYHEDEPTQIVRENIFKFLSEYFRNEFMNRDGRNQLFILSDAGMGKTSLLVMLKLLHLTAFFPKLYDCELLKLGEETLAEIENLKPNARKTILLLDALDEDPVAWGNIENRLKDILNNTNLFYRVLLTCRTQFFPDIALDPFNRPGRFEYKGYICPAKYLSLFDLEKILKYLDLRFPNRWYNFLTPKKSINRDKALEVISKMGSLKCRPMLLAYIEDILESGVNLSSAIDFSEFNIYKALIEAWLLREERKGAGTFTKGELFRLASIIATYLQVNGKRYLKKDEIHDLNEQYPELNKLKFLHMTGRSLLNKNSNGDYRFSHYSIQEYLLAERIISDQYFKEFFKAKGTDNILKIVRSELSRLSKQKLLNVFENIPYEPEMVDRHWLALRESILAEVVTKEDYATSFDS
jgi:hypothetical protein